VTPVLTIRVRTEAGRPDVLALPVRPVAGDGTDPGTGQPATSVPPSVAARTGRGGKRARSELHPEAATLAAPLALTPDSGVLDEVRAFLRDIEHTGAAGTVHPLPRPLRQPGRLLLVGVGGGDEGGWRAAGSALTRAARNDPTLTVALPANADPTCVRGLVEGLWLASYRFRLGADPADKAPRLRTVRLATDDPDTVNRVIDAARAVVEATFLARDLTNTPSDRKSPSWFAQRVSRAAEAFPRLRVRVRDETQLAAEGFGGILAVGGGSSRPPRLVELSWRPGGARTHVVLVGKGITFDTGGICIKTREGMKLMRKDMGGAAAVVAATIGAAALDLPVRVTALAPLAENMPGANAYRPGDVVRHYGGQTSEILNTDAEGRVVLADALSYAVRRLNPDVIVDLATLTGAQSVALGKRTAALMSDAEPLVEALRAAAAEAGERVWRLPLVDDYVEGIGSEVADVANSANIGAGSVLAALYLREFVGPARDRWAHLDMSAPAWSDAADGELPKGATGWGVRTLLRWLAAAASQAPPEAPAASQAPPEARAASQAPPEAPAARSQALAPASV
jgi:leucyl aminopeptidase